LFSNRPVEGSAVTREVIDNAIVALDNPAP
jgi:hypothetical protein